MSHPLRDLDELRTFLQIAESKGITRAGRVLGLPTTTVSRHLARLEKRLGVTLALRTTRSLTITEAGERLYERGLRILAEADAAVSELAEADAMVGELRVEMPSLLAERFRSSLYELIGAHPKLSLRLFVTDRPAELTARDVAEKGLDAIVLVGVVPEVSLIARRLGTIDSVLAASKSYVETHGLPTRLSELSQHECLCYVGERLQRDWVLEDVEGREHHVAIGGQFASTSSQELRAALLAGLGIGPIARHDLEPGLVPIFPEFRFARLSIWIAYAESRRGSLRVAELERALRASF